MDTNHRTASWRTLTVFLVGLITLGSVAVCTSSCSIFQGAQHIEEMDDAQFASYCTRVRAWSSAAAYTLVAENTIQAHEAQAFASVARVAAGGPTALIDLAKMAKQAGLKGPLLFAVLIEGQALIDAHDFADTRVGAVLLAVATGVDEGTAVAMGNAPVPASLQPIGG